MYIIQGVVGEEVNIVYYRYYLDLVEGVEVTVIEYFVSFNDVCYFIGVRFIINVVVNVYLQYIKLVFENSVSYYFVYNDLLLVDDVIVFSYSFLLGGVVLRYNISM